MRPVAPSPHWMFQIKANIWSEFFLRQNFFTGVLKIYIAKKNLLIQTEKIEHILPVLLKKKNL